MKCAAAKGNTIYSATYSLFGVGLEVVSDDRAALALAAAFCQPDTAPEGAPLVRVALHSGEAPAPDAPVRVEAGCLTYAQDGISLTADGPGGMGSCILPERASDESRNRAADMVNTLLLFLVAQAGRIPVHASAVMMGDVAVVLAGRSGSGKSTLALAADRAGFPILSDDTIYVELGLRLWAQPQAIHVFEKDAPAGAPGNMRYRNGRWKRALPVTAGRMVAEKSVLCVLARGEVAQLDAITIDDAVAHLTAKLEPGYDFYGAGMDHALRTLARGGCWRLTLSRDPNEALALLRERFMPATVHERYTTIVAEIEARFPVAEWRLGDVPVWPLARFELYLDMHRAAYGGTPSPKSRSLRKLAAACLRPWINLWRARRNRRLLLRAPKEAYAVLLGDGVSGDWVEGVYRDRFGEPVLAQLERRGRKTLLVQSGDLRRFPWQRASFAANIVEAQAVLASGFCRKKAHLPAHDAVADYVAKQAVAAPSLRRSHLVARARMVYVAAGKFEKLLKRARPIMAFVVNYAAGLGPAFVLACRRRAILSVDLQRAPYAGAPMSYCWKHLPAEGYATLPDAFWSWCSQEKKYLPRHAAHRILIGGHPQLLALGDPDAAESRCWEDVFRTMAGDLYEKEIVVALQPLSAPEGLWERLAKAIETSPATWRWWIRRHPAMTAGQDAACGPMLSLFRPNVVVDPQCPLPVLLRQASALVSLASGAAVEAGYLGVPAFFLATEANMTFGELIAAGKAAVTKPEDLVAAIANLPARDAGRAAHAFPPLSASLAILDRWARDGDPAATTMAS